MSDEKSIPGRDDDVSDVPRAKRFGRMRRFRRVMLGVLVVIVLAGVGAGVYALTRLRWDPETGKLNRLVVICESELEDGTKVAGVVALIDADKSITVFDPAAEVVIPGTSYDTLEDALSMGGPDEVVSVAVGDGEKPRGVGWVFLGSDVWPELVDDAGGIEVSIPDATTVFDGSSLHRFYAGEAKLDGPESAALLMGAGSFETTGGPSQVRSAVGRSVAEAVITQSGLVLELVEAGRAECSGTSEQLSEFLSSVR